MKDIVASSLVDFKKQLDGDNTPINVPSPMNANNVVQLKKNLVISRQSDFAGCSHIRNIWWFNYLNAVFGKADKLNCIVSRQFNNQPDLLVRAKTLWFQRVMSPQELPTIKQYKDNQKRLGYKMVYDIDDYIWGNNELQGGTKEDGVPSYNFGSRIDQATKDSAIEIMNLMDLVCVSSDYLGDMLRHHGVKTEIKLLKNTVSQSFWGNRRKPYITSKIKKPKIMWSGSPTHWNQSKKLKGDIDNAWLEFIMKSVKDNKIEFYQMGCSKSPNGNVVPPFFFNKLDGLKNFHKIGWQNSWMYHLPIMNTSPHFSIAPLVDNNFNRSKSDIKKIESFAGGSLFVGTKFRSGKPSPYDDSYISLYDDCSVKDIEECFEKYSEPELYNHHLDMQYKYMHSEGRFTESPIFINHLTSLL